MEETKPSLEAKIRISRTEIEISGPPDFVERQIDKQTDLVRSFIDKLKDSPHVPIALPGESFTSNLLPATNNDTAEFTDYEEVKGSKDFFERYSSVVAVNNNKIQFLAPIPGAKLGARMVNVVLMYLFVKAQMSVESVTFSELRDVCEMHGELDSGHFAEVLKKNKRLFLVDGTGRNMIAKLTMPGRRDAENLLNSLK